MIYEKIRHARVNPVIAIENANDALPLADALNSRMIRPAASWGSPFPVAASSLNLSRQSAIVPAVLRAAVLPVPSLRVAVVRSGALPVAVFRAAVLGLAVLRDAALRVAILRVPVFRAALLRPSVLRVAVLRDPDLPALVGPLGRRLFGMGNSKCARLRLH